MSPPAADLLLASTLSASPPPGSRSGPVSGVVKEIVQERSQYV
jgi:hypothetical protein